jgi:hypothetical protein
LTSSSIAIGFALLSLLERWVNVRRGATVTHLVRLVVNRARGNWSDRPCQRYGYARDVSIRDATTCRG